MTTIKDEIDYAIYAIRGHLSYLGRQADKIDDEDQRAIEDMRSELETLCQKLRYPILRTAAA